MVGQFSQIPGTSKRERATFPSSTPATGARINVVRSSMLGSTFSWPGCPPIQAWTNCVARAMRVWASVAFPLAISRARFRRRPPLHSRPTRVSPRSPRIRSAYRFPSANIRLDNGRRIPEEALQPGPPRPQNGPNSRPPREGLNSLQSPTRDSASFGIQSPTPTERSSLRSRFSRGRQSPARRLSVRPRTSVQIPPGDARSRDYVLRRRR